jgi:hypothetical protein
MTTQKVIILTPLTNIIKDFSLPLMKRPTTPEPLSFQSRTGLVFLGSSFPEKKGFLGYLASSSITKKKLYNIDTSSQYYGTFFFALMNMLNKL